MSPQRKRRRSASGLKVRAIRHAVLRWVESLESRQMLTGVTTFPIPGASSDNFSWNGSSHMVKGPDGNLWFTDPGNNQIDSVSPSGTITQYTLPDAANDPNPDDIVAGPDGNLWFTASNSDEIGRITTSGTITEFTTPSASSYPTGIAVGADGNLWFTESGTNMIGRITTSGTITEYSTTLDLSSTDEMVTAHGKVWFLAYDDNSGDNEIANVDAAGKVTSFVTNASTNDMTLGPDGNVWLASSGEIDQVDAAGTVKSFSISTGDDAYSITTGPDGNLWFALDGTNDIGRMTTAGAFSEFQIPDPNATADGDTTIYPGALAAGPDGNLWFSDDFNPQVGDINLSNALLASGDNLTETAGKTTTETIGSFVDFAGGTTASNYSATITWDDGSTSTGTITPNSSGGFDVSVTRDWQLTDSAPTVTITDLSDTTRTATAQSSVSVTPPQPVGTGVNISATAAQSFTGTVATFTNVDVNSISSYSATIDWGDGQSSTGTVTANASGGFDVSGTHIYASSGTFDVTTDLSPWQYGFLYPVAFGSGPIPLGAPVANAASGSNALTVSKPVHGSKPIALNTGGIAQPLSSAASGATTGSGGSSSAIALPIEPGNPILPIRFPGFAIANSTANVAEGEMNGTGYTVQATTTAPFNGVVAAFTLTDPSLKLSDLQAQVVWSDSGVFDWFPLSMPPSTGTITSNGQGGFTVSVSTQFTNPGWSHFTVNITNSSGTQVGIAYGQIIIDSPIIWLPMLDQGGTATSPVANTTAAAATKDGASLAASAVNPDFSEQASTTPSTIHVGAAGGVSGALGTLSGITSNIPKHADLKGTANWGDGTSSAVTLVSNGKGKFKIDGTHHYTQSGSFNVSVNIQQTLYTNGKPSSVDPMLLPTITQTVNYTKPGPITTGGIAIEAIVGQEFSGPVATLTAPSLSVSVDRTATIYWGDGSHSTGTIAASGSDDLTLTVSGDHTYKKAGTYHIHVVVTQTPTQTPPKGTTVAKVLANIVTIATVSAA